MKKQLQGISLILFGFLMMLFSMLDPWIPILGDALTILVPWIGVFCGIVGLVFSFSKED